jgi:thymidine kinase
MPRLDIIIGPMFAGKSTELIKIIRKLNVLDKKYISVKPIIDKRYSEKQIVSHNNDRVTCSCFDSINDFISDINVNNLDTIFIEEGQFFPDLKNGVLRLVEDFDCNVVIVGLDGDYNRNKFGQILDLIPYSDSCKKITALCKRCNDGTPAIFSHRNNNSTKQIDVGVADYESLCRKHYLEINK